MGLLNEAPNKALQCRSWASGEPSRLVLYRHAYLVQTHQEHQLVFSSFLRVGHRGCKGEQIFGPDGNARVPTSFSSDQVNKCPPLHSDSDIRAAIERVRQINTFGQVCVSSYVTFRTHRWSRPARRLKPVLIPKNSRFRFVSILVACTELKSENPINRTLPVLVMV